MGALEWAEVLTLPQKAQALGLLDALLRWGPEWLEGLPGLESRTGRGGERGELKTEPVSGQNERLPVPQFSSLTPCSLPGSPHPQPRGACGRLPCAGCELCGGAPPVWALPCCKQALFSLSHSMF